MHAVPSLEMILVRTFGEVYYSVYYFFCLNSYATFLHARTSIISEHSEEYIYYRVGLVKRKFVMVVLRLVAFDPHCGDLGNRMALSPSSTERSPLRLVQLEHFRDCHPEAVLSRYNF